MTTTTPKLPLTSPGPTTRAGRSRGSTTLVGPVAAPAVRQRRNWGLAAAAVALVAVCGLGAGYYASQGGKTESIVAVKSPILSGSPLTAAQLGTTQIQLGTGLDTIPAGDLTRLIGKYSTINLPAGALLTPQMIQDTLVPSPGKAVVGVPFKHGQIPARGLQPGDKIRVVVTAAANGANIAAAGKTWDAQVVTVEQGGGQPANSDTAQAGQPGSDGTTTFDLLVDDDIAASLAAAAGGANVAAVLETGARAGAAK